MRALVECKADVEARDKVRCGRGGLRLRVREAGVEMECQGAVFRGGGVECGMCTGERERSWISKRVVIFS